MKKKNLIKSLLWDYENDRYGKKATYAFVTFQFIILYPLFCVAFDYEFNYVFHFEMVSLFLALMGILAYNRTIDKKLSNGVNSTKV